MNVLGSHECSLAANFAAPLRLTIGATDFIVSPIRLRDISEAENIVRSNAIDGIGELSEIWNQPMGCGEIMDRPIHLGDVFADERAVRWLIWRAVRMTSPEITLPALSARPIADRVKLADVVVRLSGLAPDGDDGGQDPMNWQQNNALICHFYPAYTLERIADLTWPQYVGLMQQFPDVLKMTEKPNA